MLAIVSPAKTLDFESKLPTKKASQPIFKVEANELIKNLSAKTPADLSKLMGISDNLAELNHQRYLQWTPDFDDGGRPAALAFKGDVYLGLDAYSLGERDFSWAQKHLRILSGLHGLLRPLDLIHPYRLEMGTRLATKKGKNLYDYWQDKVTCELNKAIAEQGDNVLINLASNEYYNVVQPQQVDARIVDVQFKELRGDKYQFLSFFAKKARGLMARYMIDHRVKSLKKLKEFNYEGYAYNPKLSEKDSWVFTRTPQP